MSCYHPITAWQPFHEGGKITFDKPPSKPIQRHKEIQFPCRQCLGCRIDKQTQWCIRLLHENQLHQNAQFITLTYDEDHIPIDFGLHHEHFQAFMKKLRKLNPEKRLRFFMCGEYGSRGSRPHYHAIIFGLKLDDLKVYKTDYSKGDEYKIYTSETLEKIWARGMVTIGYVNKATMNYVSGYMLKEQVLTSKGDYSITDPETGEIYDRKAPYIRMSNRPGIGGDWIEKFTSDVYPHDHVIIEGKKKSVPDYYLKKLEQLSPELAAEIKAKRQEVIDSQEFKEQNTPEKLAKKKEVTKAKRRFFKKGEAL